MRWMKRNSGEQTIWEANMPYATCIIACENKAGARYAVNVNTYKHVFGSINSDLVKVSRFLGPIRSLVKAKAVGLKEIRKLQKRISATLARSLDAIDSELAAMDGKPGTKYRGKEGCPR